ncbi:MAG: radical SAM family heme chaperone HemW [Gammaproteobacteria bacterium]|nr:radical SAM family heme chaperone HemW [Gammaproteobacteria bacterium]
MNLFADHLPLSLYIHIPWCIQKCPYCDFNSHALTQPLAEDRYVDALLQDFKAHLSDIAEQCFVSVFFGGGTPSLFSPKAIGRILNGIDHHMPFSKTTEITLEANPGTIDEKHFAGFKQAGINRLSIGIQSLQNDKLKTLGRIHDRKQALRAIDIAKNAGFDNFNLDLMHGLPEQTAEDALQDLSDALNTNPTHLSWYQLTIEPNTAFHHQPPTLPPENILHAIQNQGEQILRENGFERYEISAWSKPNRQCVHNNNYWQFGDYLGIGAGAHSKITDTKKQIITRYMKWKHPKEYLNPDKNFIAQKTIVPHTELPFEFMLNALRLIDGVPANIFTEHTGLHLESIAPLLEKARAKKLLNEDNKIICPTTLGHQFLNDLTEIFMS